jgi:hypothetical protein
MNLDIGLIGSEDVPLFVGVSIDKRLYTNGGGLAVIRYHLMRDGDAVDIFQGLSGFPERKTEIDPIGKTQRHDIGIVLGELQRRGILRKRSDVHLKKIHREFTVDIVEFILVFSVILLQIRRVNLFEAVKIIRTLWIDAFVDDEVLTVFLWSEGMGTVWTLEGYDL